MLNQRQFDLLLLLKGQKERFSQRQLAEKLDCSLGTVNRLLKELTEEGYFDGRTVTDQGRAALAPYRVKRALLFAAGFGERLVPITLNTPKALVRVQGRRMIDTLLDALKEAGIEEIYIVRGYLKEQFDQLLYDYPEVKLIDNPLYAETNNISSAMCVRGLFGNAYVMDADLILRNPALIRSYEYQSNLLGVPMERSDDWCVSADEHRLINGMSVGGLNVWREVGISYWSTEDGRKLEADLQEVYDSPGGRERFWEQVPLMYKKEHYQVRIRECRAEDVTEIDTFKELRAMDPAYRY